MQPVGLFFIALVIVVFLIWRVCVWCCHVVGFVRSLHCWGDVRGGVLLLGFWMMVERVLVSAVLRVPAKV